MISLIDEEGVFRVKSLYRDIYNGENSLEAGFVFKSWYHSMFAGTCIGATFAIKPVYDDFRVRFNEYQFQNRSTYARKLLDCTLSTCARNGIKMGWRASLLSLVFTLTSSTLAVYHNEIRFSDMCFTFALTGGFYTFHRGPKAMFAGAALCGLVGLPVATLIKLYFWSTGVTYKELTDRARPFLDAPYIKRKKEQNIRDKRWRDLSISMRDDFKHYLYHQRRVERLEEMGIVDNSFQNLKPTEGKPPSEFEKNLKENTR